MAPLAAMQAALPWLRAAAASSGKATVLLSGGGSANEPGPVRNANPPEP
eukprot:COSAG04_NODE_15854_length_518_cov_0.983294_2_plen_49_part_00